ncbi:MAG: DUF4040 domain-containing protein [Fimbriimonadaceae bacterium]|nr:DUF4040 domain-containing protein [Fimbriimonadaceae bacterium]
MPSLLELIVLAAFGLGLVVPAWWRSLGKRGSAWTAVVPGGLFVWLAAMGPGEQTSFRPWAPDLGAELAFRLDPLSWIFCLLITGIGALVFLYASGYFGDDPATGRFLSTLACFMGAMLGLALADNAILLFVFWELTSITSFLLIGFKSAKEKARKAAIQALFVTGAGGLAMLAGLVWLGLESGTFRLSEMPALPAASAGAVPILLLVALGAFTKSAQFPFHFWLPGAMEAPTPVSSYLHSATMVKAGVFLLARLNPQLGELPLWTPLLATAGALTLLTGGLLSLRATDLKQILAYSTVAGLGALVLALGVGGESGAKAFAAFLVAHALYKGCLFMAAGSVDHEAGSRDVRELGGLARLMPWTAAGAGLGMLSMAGLIPFLGFVGKEYLIGAALKAPWTLPAVIVGAATAGWAGFQTAIRPFHMGSTPEAGHEAPWSMRVGPLVLGGLALALGLLLPVMDAARLNDVGAAVWASGDTPQIKLWAGINAELMISLASLALGIILFVTWPRWQQAVVERADRVKFGPAEGCRALLEVMPKLAGFAAAPFQQGRLRIDLLVVVLTATLLPAIALLRHGGLSGDLELTMPLIHEVMVVAAAVIGAILSSATQSRLAAIAFLGVSGFSTALLFAFFGAPDLAVTQLLVETLAVVFFVLVFSKLPRFAALGSRWVKLRDAAIASAFGLVMTALVLAVLSADPMTPVSAQHLALSVPEAKGANVVNTILVDFRALDTLGEITVLVLAALGVFSLLRMDREEAEAAA